MKRSLLIIVLCVSSFTTYAQSSNSHLLFQYFGINENQSEINYISWFLDNKGFTMPGPEQERAIMDAHNYYITHKEEIDITTKANELILFRSAVRSAIAEGWAQAFSSFASSIATGQKQQGDYQKKLNRDRDIQAYIAKNSSSIPKQYSQNFGSTPIDNNPTPTPRVTTSNGFDEPLSSPDSYSTGQGIETVGMLVNNGIQQNVRLKINGNVIVGRYVGGTVRSPWGEGWVQDNLQGMPTSIQLDGEWAKMYKNRASSRDIDNAIIYF